MIELFICRVHMDAWEFTYRCVEVRGVSKCEVCGKYTNFVVMYEDRKEIPMTIVKYLN